MNQQTETPTTTAAAAAATTDVVISNPTSQPAINAVSQSLQAAIMSAAEQINASLQGAAGGSSATDVHSAAVSQLSASSTIAKLEMAKQLAKQIGEKTVKTGNDSNILNPANAISRLAAAKLSAEKLNARLGYRPSPNDPTQAPVGPLTFSTGPSAAAGGSASPPSDDIDDEAYMEKLRLEALEKQRIHQQQRFNAEMEINDFPDHIRFKLTMRVYI